MRCRGPPPPSSPLGHPGSAGLLPLCTRPAQPRRSTPWLHQHTSAGRHGVCVDSCPAPPTPTHLRTYTPPPPPSVRCRSHFCWWLTMRCRVRAAGRVRPFAAAHFPGQITRPGQSTRRAAGACVPPTKVPQPTHAGILSSFFFKYADSILKKQSSTIATILTGAQLRCCPPSRGRGRQRPAGEVVVSWACTLCSWLHMSYHGILLVGCLAARVC